MRYLAEPNMGIIVLELYKSSILMETDLACGRKASALALSGDIEE